MYNPFHNLDISLLIRWTMQRQLRNHLCFDVQCSLSLSLMKQLLSLFCFPRWQFGFILLLHFIQLLVNVVLIDGFMIAEICE